jgi:hypothetical protein
MFMKIGCTSKTAKEIVKEQGFFSTQRARVDEH